MVQVIVKMDNWRISQWYKEVLVVDNNSIVDYYGQRSKFKELGRIDDNLEFGHCLFLTISYL